MRFTLVFIALANLGWASASMAMPACAENGAANEQWQAYWRADGVVAAPARNQPQITVHEGVLPVGEDGSPLAQLNDLLEISFFLKEKEGNPLYYTVTAEKLLLNFNYGHEQIRFTPTQGAAGYFTSNNQALASGDIRLAFIFGEGHQWSIPVDRTKEYLRFGQEPLQKMLQQYTQFHVQLTYKDQPIYSRFYTTGGAAQLLAQAAPLYMQARDQRLQGQCSMQ